MSEHPNNNDLSENGPEMAGDAIDVYSVGEISALIRQTVEDEFPYVRIQGEISGFTRAASGHLYFSLKDEKDVLDSVCWRGSVGKLQAKPEDGLEVIATGRITTYGPRSRYQMVVEQIEVAGEGALLKLLEERKKKLAAEGLFNEEIKQEIPYLPTVIGVVTSPTGAVIRDILHRLRERFPVHVLVWPVPVQGDGAAEKIAGAINGFDKMPLGGKVPRPDLIIVARGGGSIEDLWAFNEEVVVRATANCTIPLISAVGHETDTTLIDFASDLRAPTPTAAAEMAVPVRSELVASVMSESSRLVRRAARITQERKTKLDGLKRGIPDLAHIVGTAAQRLDDWSARFLRGGTALVTSRRNKLIHTERLLKGFSYQRVLDKGFVLVEDRNGKAITRAASLKIGDDVTLRMADGSAGARITEKDGPNKKTKAKPKKEDLRQGKLL